MDEASLVFDRILAESDDPAFRASALLSRSVGEPRDRAWELAQEALRLAPLPDLPMWHEDAAAVHVGWAAFRAGHYPPAARMAHHGLQRARETWSRVHQCSSIWLLAGVHAVQGHLDQAAETIGHAVAVARHLLGNDNTIGFVRHSAADIARLGGDHHTAAVHVDEVRRAAEHGDFPNWAAVASIQDALISRDQGDLTRADQHLDDAQQIADQHGFRGIPLWIHAIRATLHIRTNTPKEALQELAPVLADPDRLDWNERLDNLDTVAIALTQAGRPQSAAQLFGAVDHLRDHSGAVVPPPDQAIRNEAIENTRTQLGDHWETETTRGAGMGLAEAIAFARDHTEEP